MKWACGIVWLNVCDFSQLLEDNRALNILAHAPAFKRVNARRRTHEQLAQKQLWFYSLSQTEENDASTKFKTQTPRKSGVENT